VVDRWVHRMTTARTLMAASHNMGNSEFVGGTDRAGAALPQHQADLMSRSAASAEVNSVKNDGRRLPEIVGRAARTA
jgi:hypothetical protein